MSSLKAINIKHLILWVFPASILLLYYVAYYPGCYSEDSEAYFKYFDDHHPLFFLIYLRVIKFFSGNYDGYIVLNLIFFSFLYSRSLLFFLKYGIPFPFLLFLAIIFPLMPVTGYMMITYWKDVSYAIAFCYLSFLLIEFVIKKQNNEDLRKYYFIEIFIAFLFLIGTRHNGIITSLLTLIPLIWYFNIYRRKLFYSFFGAFCLVTLLGFSAKQFWGASTGWMSFDHLLVRHLSVYLHESKLDSTGVEVLSVIMPLKAFEDGFNYFSHDGYAYGPNAESYRNNVKKYKWKIRKTFCTNLIKKPLVFLKSELLMTQLIWRPIPIKGSFRNSYCINSDSANKNVITSFFNFLLLQTDRIEKPFYTRLFFWSGSFQVWVIFIFAITAFMISGRFALTPFLPVVGNLLSLFIALISQEFRYVFGEVLVLPILFLYLMYLAVRSFKKI